MNLTLPIMYTFTYYRSLKYIMLRILTILLPKTNEVYILGHVLSTKYALKYKLHSTKNTVCKEFLKYFYFSPLLIGKRKEREKKACCFKYCLRKLLRKLVSMTSFSKMRAKITRNFSPAHCILTLCIFK